MAGCAVFGELAAWWFENRGFYLLQMKLIR